jgi:hypothetical protein
MYIKLTPATVVPDESSSDASGTDVSGTDVSGADVSGTDINALKSLTGDTVNWDASGAYAKGATAHSGYAKGATAHARHSRYDVSGSRIKSRKDEIKKRDPLIHDSSGECVLWSKDMSGNDDYDLIDPNADIQENGSTIVIFEPPIQKPYSTYPINNVDDYEYNLVFRGEGDRAMTKKTRDFLMSKYPQDWSTQPPSSEKFQTGLAKFNESFRNVSAKEQKEIDKEYSKIDGIKMIPPDYLVEDEQEREIIAKYTPRDPKSLTTYDAEDAKELITRIYDAKGLVPSYKQTGENVFTIFSSTPKQPVKSSHEESEQAVASINAVPSSGEDTIVVPQMEYAANKMKDPFFTPSEKTRDMPHDYTSWTPGLERMFAPTYYKRKWY